MKQQRSRRGLPAGGLLLGLAVLAAGPGVSATPATGGGDLAEARARLERALAAAGPEGPAVHVVRLHAHGVEAAAALAAVCEGRARTLPRAPAHPSEAAAAASQAAFERASGRLREALSALAADGVATAPALARLVALETAFQRSLTALRERLLTLPLPLEADAAALVAAARAFAPTADDALARRDRCATTLRAGAAGAGTQGADAVAVEAERAPTALR